MEKSLSIWVLLLPLLELLGALVETDFSIFAPTVELVVVVGGDSAWISNGGGVVAVVMLMAG